MDKETKYKKTYSLKDAFFPLLIFTILITYFLFNAGGMLEMITCLVILSFIFFVWMGMIVGTLKGKMQILKEKKYIEKMNPYIYYRNLPNNFGIGVTSLLLDSTIENDKDIVAVILDLCAKKYLRLIKQNDKYVIQVLKEIDHHLLSNEKYILTLIRNNDIKNINYQEWYNYCMQDGIDLGLYYHKEIDIRNHESHDDDIVKKTEIIHLTISIAIAILIFVVSLFNVHVLVSLANGIVVFMLSYIVLFIPFYFIHAFTALKSIGDSVKDENYKMTIENHLKKTEKRGGRITQTLFI